MIKIWIAVVVSMLVGIAITNGANSDIPKIKGRLLTVQEGCGYSRVLTRRIVGGSAAKNGAFPWIALLGFNRTFIKSYDKRTFDITFASQLSFDCGGSLITSKHVLSAAHCIDDNLILVRLGEYDLSTTSDGDHQDVSIDHVVKHEQFDGVRMIDDIAIIHLDHDVDFTDRIRPVCLPIDGDIVHRNFVESNPFVAGYGYVSESGDETSILMQLQVPVVETNECKKAYLEAKADSKRKKSDCTENAKIVFDEHILCAGYNDDGGKGTNFGDSGGPLVNPVHENGTFPYYQIGISSGADDCIKSGFFGIYTSVQYYADWIRNNLK